MLDPINRVFLPRADIATETLVAGLVELGWEVDDVTAYRTVRAAPPPAPVREAIKSGKFDAVVFTSSSTVRNLVGIAGKPHAVDGDRGDRPGHGEDRRGARPAGRRAGARAVGGGARRRARRLRRRPAGRAARGRSAGDQAVASAVRRARRKAAGSKSAPGAASSPPSSALGGCGAPPALRELVAETTLAPRQLVLPVFVREGADRAACRSAACRASSSTRATRCGGPPPRRPSSGLGGIMLFGVPETKDAAGSRRLRRRRDPQRRDPRRRRRGRRRAAGDEPTCASTSSPTTATAACSAPMARSTTTPRSRCTPRWRVAQAAAGVDVVGPSGMMDGQVAVIRAALDAAGHTDVGDPGLLGEVRLRLLRPVPRGGGLQPRGATAAPTSRTAQPRSRACARRSSTSRRAPTW